MLVFTKPSVVEYLERHKLANEGSGVGCRVISQIGISQITPVNILLSLKMYEVTLFWLALECLL